MTTELKNVKVVVLCTNSNGEPEFHTCTPSVTPAQMADGEHLNLAKENAEDNGYEHPMIAFEATSPAAKQLGDILVWL